MENLPPSNIKTEQAVLGCMMIDQTALEYCVELLNAMDFYREVHQDVFRGLRAMALREEPPDLITLQEELRRSDKLEEVGGTEYLMALVETVPTAANVKHYTKIVLDKSIRRQVQAYAAELIGIAQDTDRDHVLDTLMAKALAISDRKEYATQSMMDVCMEAGARLKTISQGGDPRLIPFRLEPLRKLLYGLEPGQLAYVVGPTGGGKTVALLDMAANAGALSRPVLFVSIEMDAPDLVNRMLCADTRQDMHEIRDGIIDWDRTNDKYAEYTHYPMEIVDHEVTLSNLIMTARRWKAQNIETINSVGGLIVVDYFGIIEYDSRADSEFTAEGKTSRGLKSLARELNVPVFSGLQLRKKPPGLRKFHSDPDEARGSGAILHWADKIIFIEPLEEPDTNHCQKVKLVVPKHRGGPVGSITVMFNRRYLRFEPITDAYQAIVDRHAELREEDQ